MKLIINRFEVSNWDTAFIAVSVFFFVMALVDGDWRYAAAQFLFVYLAVYCEVLKSKVFHLEKQNENSTLPSNV